MIRVYHHSWNSDWSFGVVGGRFPKDYSLVAQVATENLEEVFQLTNHIDSDWTLNKGVRAISGSHRSSSVGDIFVTEKGEAHLVASMGFVKVGTYIDGVFTAEKMTVWAMLNPKPEPGEKKVRYFYDKGSFEISKKVREERGEKVDSWEADLSEAIA